jgi:O-antigen/teichoic acid export membrane protein
VSTARRGHARHVAGGTVRLFLAEALLLPTGLVTAALLTRRLGPEDYGLFTLASVVVAWVEWTIVSMFARATVSVVAEARDWRTVGGAILRLHLLVSVAAAAALWLAAGWIAAILREPALAGYIRLLAIDLPLFSLAHAHRGILVGIGGYGRRALLSATRWISRMVLVVLLLDLGVRGAILATIGASVAELVIARFLVRARLRDASSLPLRALVTVAAPLFLYGVAMRILDRLDIACLKALGGSAADAGLYGAAQNACLLPAALSASFAPLVLSTLTRLLRDQAREEAARIARLALRAAIGLLPFAAVIAGTAREVVVLAFGAEFAPAAAPLAILVFAAVAMLFFSTATAIVTAGGKPAWTFAIAGPLVPLAAAGYVFAVPAHGAVGAAAVTAAAGGLGAVASAIAVRRVWAVVPPAGTLVRAALASAAVIALAQAWTTSGWGVALELAGLSAFCALAFLLLGELSRSEMRRILSLLPPPLRPPRWTAP